MVAVVLTSYTCGIMSLSYINNRWWISKNFNKVVSTATLSSCKTQMMSDDDDDDDDEHFFD